MKALQDMTDKQLATEYLKAKAASDEALDRMSDILDEQRRRTMYSEHDRIMQSANTEMSFPKLFSETTDKPV